MNATDTRARILEKNAEAIHVNGFQGTRTDKVIAELGITKGAFYHYFEDKKSLGYAIVDEILYPNYVGAWLHLEQETTQPVEAIIAGIQQQKNYCDEASIIYGCPLNNLIQEMSPLDEGFHQRLSRIVNKQIALISTALEQAKAKGQLKEYVISKDLAYFILAGIEGSWTVGKSKRSKAIFEASLNQLIHYLKLLQVS